MHAPLQLATSYLNPSQAQRLPNLIKQNAYSYRHNHCNLYRDKGSLPANRDVVHQSDKSLRHCIRHNAIQHDQQNYQILSQHVYSQCPLKFLDKPATKYVHQYQFLFVQKAMPLKHRQVRQF